MRNTKEKKGSIKKKLLATIIPLVVVTIVLLIGVTASISRNLITNLTKHALVAQTENCSSKVDRWASEIVAELNMVKNSIDTEQFDIHKVQSQLERMTFKKNKSYENGVYIGDQANNYADASNWKPDANYQVTERDWYKEGIQHDTVQFGTPYVDEMSKSYVVAATSKISHGSSAVMSADISLKSITSLVSKMRFLDTGKIILIDTNKQEVLADSNKSVVGKKLSECKGDKLYANFAKVLSSKDELTEIIGNKGTVA